jgi:lipopolysaccharide transport system permease protein
VTWASQIKADFAEMHREQIEYRELLLRLVERDLRVRYKQTAMGFGWAVFTPLINTVVFSVIFMRVAPIDTGGIPYPLFAFSGLLAWNYFASSLRFAVTSLSSNAVLVGKVYFPREILPASSVFVSGVDAFVASSVLIGMLVYYRQVPGLAIVGLPLVFMVQTLLTLGVALTLAMANLFFRDVKYLFEVSITMLMFATAVLYPTASVEGWPGLALALNPMTQIIEAYRNILFNNELPFTLAFMWTSVVSVAIFVVSWLRFHRAEFHFAEHV